MNFEAVHFETGGSVGPEVTLGAHVRLFARMDQRMPRHVGTLHCLIGAEVARELLLPSVDERVLREGAPIAGHVRAELATQHHLSSRAALVYSARDVHLSAKEVHGLEVHVSGKKVHLSGAAVVVLV